MSTRQYELIYITPPETTEEALTELHAQIVGIVEKFGATIANTENWGRRRLAYEIERHKEGVYVLEVINGPAEMTTELNRRLLVMDIVIRHLIVRVDEELAIAERAQTRRKTSSSARRVRRGLPPEREESERRPNRDDDDDDDRRDRRRDDDDDDAPRRGGGR